MTPPRDWSPDPEPWHEPDAEASSLFWTAFLTGIVLTAIVVGGVVLAVLLRGAA